MNKNYTVPQFILIAFIIWIILSYSTFAQPKIVDCWMWMPKELKYDKALNDYAPNPFIVRYRITNSGDSTLLNATAKISYDKNDLTLVNPTTSSQIMIPSTIMPNDSGIVQWELSAKNRAKGDSIEVCITITFDNYPDDIACAKVWIPPAEPNIKCSLSAPPIKTNVTKDRYIPMPFVLTADIWNDGGVQSDSMFATINLTSQLQLDISENKKAIKIVAPAKLQPGQHGTVTWTLWHPLTFDSANYQVKVNIRGKNIDSTSCEITISIPRLPGFPMLICNHTCPDSLSWNDSLGQYFPNPFTVTHAVINVGGDDADSVCSTIILPADVVLDPPTQDLKQFFNPMKVTQWNPNMPVNQVSWTLRARKIPKTRKCYSIIWRTDGTSSRGPIDPDYCEVDVCIPGVQPKLICDMTCVDSLRLDSTRTHLTPNPFIVRYVVRNIGLFPYGVRDAQLSIINGPGVHIQPQTPNPISWNKVLNRGDTIDVTWKVQVTSSLMPRTPRFSGICIDEDGDPLEFSKDVFIPAVDSLLYINHNVQSPSSFYLGQNYPNPFSKSTTIYLPLLLGEGRGEVLFKVYDIFGREVLDLTDKVQNNSALKIQNSQLPSPGIYFYRLTIGNESQTKMMMLLK